MHDLVSGALLALESDPELSASWNARSKTLFVDEYQDTDRTQYSLVKQLSGGSSRLLAVGDDDQAIYGFRGADIRNILDWKRDHPDGRILTLVGNHRSLSPILAASNRIFPDKPPEFRKILEARRPSAGRKPTWFRARTPLEELRWVRARLGDEIRHGRKPSELCVLYRGNREERPLRQALEGLPIATGEGEGISLMTIHAAKGLEWPVVVLAGQDRPIDEPGRLAPFAQDEERRLFYVACTRARDRLYLSGCDTRGSKREIRPRKPHPWMELVEPDVTIRPSWWIRLGRRIWAPAARMALDAPP
jgi:superfamily I DNA/RNA helicase